MKNIIIVATSFILTLPVIAQKIETTYDIASQVKIINSNTAVKLYKGSFELHDTANTPKAFSYEYVADSITGQLIKAVIKDDRYNITRTYYFVNEQLIELYEKKIDQKGFTGSHTSFFRDNSYSIASTGQSEMYDNNGTLHVDSEEVLTKKVVNTSFIPSRPKRKSTLEDAYILLMDFRRIRDRK